MRKVQLNILNIRVLYLYNVTEYFIMLLCLCVMYFKSQLTILKCVAVDVCCISGVTVLVAGMVLPAVTSLHPVTHHMTVTMAPPASRWLQVDTGVSVPRIRPGPGVNTVSVLL